MLANLPYPLRFSLAYLGLILLAVGALGGFWIYREYNSFAEESLAARQRHLSDQDQRLVWEVTRAVEYAQQVERTTRERLRDELRERVQLACDLTLALHQQLGADAPRARLEGMVAEALRGLRFWGRRGYYFAAGLDGVMRLASPDQGSLEGLHYRDMPPEQGEVLREFVELAGEQGGGFLQYSWTRPFRGEQAFAKLSYVKRLPVLDWLVGCGEYLAAHQRETQDKVLHDLARLSAQRPDNAIFVGTFAGFSLLGPALGQNMYAPHDAEERLIVQRLIQTAKSGGGFLTHAVPTRAGSPLSPRRCYLLALPEWEWYVGAGYDLEELERHLAGQERMLVSKVRGQVGTILLILGLTGLLALLIGRELAGRLRQGFSVFEEYFRRAASGLTPIATGRLQSPEFRRLAGAVNRMVEERLAVEAEKARMAGQLLQSQKMEALGTLAGGIAHDFNNILASVMGYSELGLAKRQAGEDCQKELDEVLKAAERAKRLVRQILTFSRKMDSELRLVDLNQEIRRTLDLLANILPKMVTIRAELGEGLWPVMADPTQLEQVLLNLCSNANDAMPEGGVLRLATANLELDQEYCRRHLNARPGPHVRITVADNGRGMAPDILAHIFEPFFTTKEVGKGTGLGLSTVFGIVQEHGGHLDCQSTVGAGTTFHVYLPRAGT